MAGSFTALYYHFVFSTKNREPLVTSDFRSRLYDYIGGITNQRKSRLLACGGVEDHAHLLVSMNKEMAVSDFLRDIKSNSSLWVHETFKDKRNFGWQDGYGAFTVSSSALDRVRAYISNQEAHHRRQDFRTEFISLLKKHAVSYDERYIWR